MQLNAGQLKTGLTVISRFWICPLNPEFETSHQITAKLKYSCAFYN